MTDLKDVILEILETKQPDNVKELIQIVQQQIDASLDEIEKEIKILHKKGLVTLEKPNAHKQDFTYFISSKNSRWFWIIIAISLLSFISIISLPETEIPFSYIRYMFGFILTAFLPGFCLTETLFPKVSALDKIERITFSIGLSFVVTALTGLFLSFTSIGLTLETALPALSSLVIILAIVALYRKYKEN